MVWLGEISIMQNPWNSLELITAYICNYVFTGDCWELNLCNRMWECRDWGENWIFLPVSPGRNHENYSAGEARDDHTDPEDPAHPGGGGESVLDAMQSGIAGVLGDSTQHDGPVGSFLKQFLRTTSVLCHSFWWFNILLSTCIFRGQK